MPMTALLRYPVLRREELLGQPHNLVRHPENAAGALFADLWQTVASKGNAGAGWSKTVPSKAITTGLTPFVVPMLEGDQTVCGYMSVRTPASRSAIREAEAALPGKLLQGASATANQPRRRPACWYGSARFYVGTDDRCCCSASALTAPGRHTA